MTVVKRMNNLSRGLARRWMYLAIVSRRWPAQTQLNEPRRQPGALHLMKQIPSRLRSTRSDGGHTQHAEHPIPDLRPRRRRAALSDTPISVGSARRSLPIRANLNLGAFPPASLRTSVDAHPSVPCPSCLPRSTALLLVLALRPSSPAPPHHHHHHRPHYHHPPLLLLCITLVFFTPSLDFSIAFCPSFLDPPNSHTSRFSACLLWQEILLPFRHPFSVLQALSTANCYLLEIAPSRDSRVDW